MQIGIIADYINYNEIFYEKLKNQACVLYYFYCSQSLFIKMYVHTYIYKYLYILFHFYYCLCC